MDEELLPFDMKAALLDPSRIRYSDGSKPYLISFVDGYLCHQASASMFPDPIATSDYPAFRLAPDVEA